MEKIKYVGYYRVSTASQGRSGLGLEAQADAVRAFAASSQGTIIATFTEIESGRKSDRPELAKALAHAKRTGARLVIAKLDRLSRNVAFLANLIESNVDFVAVDNATANRLTLHVLAAVAEAEARATSERTKAALAAYQARGGKLGAALSGSRPTAADRKLGSLRGTEANRSKARSAVVDLLPEIENMARSGLSLRSIADAMNHRGHTTARGSKWSSVQVLRVMKREGIERGPTVSA